MLREKVYVHLETMEPNLLGHLHSNEDTHTLISKFQNLHDSFRHYSVILIFKIYVLLRRSGKTGNGTPPARSTCEFQNIENKDQGDFRDGL